MSRTGDKTPDRVVVYREALGRLLMSHRKRGDLTIGGLGKLAGMSRAAVGRIEAGESSPNIEQLRRLGEALGTTPATLLAELERAITYLEGRRTLIVEAMPDEATARGRLLEPPRVLLSSGQPLLRVAGATLMREIEAGLALRQGDPPRTSREAFLADCTKAGIALPTSAADEQRARRELALAILEDRFDSSEMAIFGPPDPLMEDLAFIEVEGDDV